MSKSVKKNYIYNLIYQIFVLIVPILVTPYLSRVLGPEGTGQYSFTYSLANYFILVAALGFGYYAQREIANYQNDKSAQSLIFWEIIIVRLFSVGLSLAVNIVLNITGVYGAYSPLMWWWIILIVAQGFDITFLLQGNEEFAKIAIRNVIVKIISVVCIFLFVKKPSDVYIYVICFAGSTLLGNLSLWPYLFKMLCRVKFHDLKPLRHVMPTIRLFIPTIAISVYTVLDKTLIGLLVTGTESNIVDGVEVITKISDLENGYYEQAEKIVKVCMTVVTALGTVMIPRNSNEFASGNLDKVKENVYGATNFVWFMGVPLALGLAAIAGNLVPWFLGEGYDKCVLLIQLFTPLILIIGFSNVFGLQYLLPTQRDGKYTIAIVLGAVVNLALNIVCIKYLMSYGAVAASIAAELTVTVIMIVLVRKEISFLKILKQSIKYLIAGVIMFVTVYFTQTVMKPTVLFTFLLILEGAVIYFVVLLCLKDKYVLNVIKKLSGRLKPKKKTSVNAKEETFTDISESAQENSGIETKSDGE
ncbi:MAG: flippase [Clostridia bacterium]|nr:flippase [Clostridia bacterium]